MIEKTKSIALVILVALSLVQTYLLTYDKPNFGATVRTDQDYVNTEPMGTESSVEDVIFPDELMIHFGNNEHTVLYPGTTFYDMILKERIQGREFKGFQRSSAGVLNWNEVRKNDIGVELRFDVGVPVELLQKLLKLNGDPVFLAETIDRIWIFKAANSEEVRTFFFSADKTAVYESLQADLTVRDVQDYVGFGQYQTRYKATSDGIYVPVKPVRAVETIYPYESYSPELMQRNLFFDPGTTRAVEGRNGSQIYTDGKRGLQVEQNGTWITYTDPAAPQSGENLLSDNFYASVEFVNQHGGWDGRFRFSELRNGTSGTVVKFQQYMDSYPILEAKPFEYGYMSLSLQQGVVTEYNRSLITLGDKAETRVARWLPGGEELERALHSYARRSEVIELYPAVEAVPADGKKIRFVPVWAVRLTDGTQETLAAAYPAGYVPAESTDAQEDGADGDAPDDASEGESGDGAATAAAGAAGGGAALAAWRGGAAASGEADGHERGDAAYAARRGAGGAIGVAVGDAAWRAGAAGNAALVAGQNAGVAAFAALHDAAVDGVNPFAALRAGVYGVPATADREKRHAPHLGEPGGAAWSPRYAAAGGATTAPPGIAPSSGGEGGEREWIGEERKAF